MAFVNYADNDDMQNDTFKIITELFIDAIRMYRMTEVKLLYRDIDAIFLMSHKKLEGKIPDDFEKRLNDMREIIFSVPEGEGEGQLVLSAAFDELRCLLKELTAGLDEAGLLFKMRTDLDSLVTRQ